MNVNGREVQRDLVRRQRVGRDAAGERGGGGEDADLERPSGRRPGIPGTNSRRDAREIEPDRRVAQAADVTCASWRTITISSQPAMKIRAASVA